MGDRKKFALAVRRRLVERQFARLIDLISRSRKDLHETKGVRIARVATLISKLMDAASDDYSRFGNE